MFINLIKNKDDMKLCLKIKRIEDLGAIRLTGINNNNETVYVILPKYCHSPDMFIFFKYIKKGDFERITMCNFERLDKKRRGFRNRRKSLQGNKISIDEVRPISTV